MQEDTNENKIIIFEDEGTANNKNNDWFSSDDLAVSFDESGTTVEMPRTGLFNYSPNAVFSGNFIISMDILMPDGNSFLSFGFNDIQNTFVNYNGWWKTSEFKKLIIKRTDDYIKYYLDGELKNVRELDMDELYFQFRLYSPKKNFKFTFKNFQITCLTYNESSYDYFQDKLENVGCKIDLLRVLMKKYE